jgi:hypothetical protein
MKANKATVGAVPHPDDPNATLADYRPRAGMTKAELRRCSAGLNRLNRPAYAARMATLSAEPLPTPHPGDADAVQAEPEAPGCNVFAAVVKVTTDPGARPKKRMGRPPTNGVRPTMVLLRASSILKHFEEARRTLGHTASIAATVKAVRAEFDASVASSPEPLAWDDAGLRWNSPPADVMRVNASIPRMKGVNKAEVERVLAEFQPKNGSKVFRVRPHGNGCALWLGERPSTRSRRIKLR